MSKKSILVLGATGMLGHQVYRYLRSKPEYEVIGTCREPNPRVQKKMYGQTFPVFDVLLGHEDQLRNLFIEYGPFDYIINCIGAIKPSINESNPASVADAIRLNAHFPHELVAHTFYFGGKIIHPSTDCVFSGNTKAPYLETDTPDAADIYGRSKAMGESSEAMNIRTSIIGPEIHSKKSLLEWYLEQQRCVNGYINHNWNGITTLQWAKTTHDIIQSEIWKPGVQHIYTTTITKARLLEIFRQEFAAVNIKGAEIKRVCAPQEKWMALISVNIPYLSQLPVPGIVHQVRELVQRRYKG
jgi:dTDP-4-dehydrorhamnose reductase